MNLFLWGHNEYKIVFSIQFKVVFLRGFICRSLHTLFICILIILITTNSKEVDYQPIIANQERWLVDGTKFQFHKCNSKVKHLQCAIFLLSD